MHRTPHSWRLVSSGRAFLKACALVSSLSCADSRASDVVTLRVWAMGREGEVVQELMPAFERDNPGVRVEVQQVPWSAAHEKLLTAHVGDATPDITQLGNTWIPEFVALNALEPLEPYISRSAAVTRADYFPGIWDTNVIDSIVYGVPWYVDTRVIFYRTDILARAGYDKPPASWTTWLEAMRRIKAQAGPDKYAILLPTNEWPQPVVFALQRGSPLLRDGGRFGAFRDPAFRQAFEFYVGLFREGLAPKVANTQISNVYDEFARGTFAMYITGPWNIGEFRRRLPDSMQGKWATAPLPGPGGDSSRVSLAGGASLALFSASKHKEEAWRLIEYLSAPAQQIRFFHLTGDLPARVSAWRDTSLANDPYARAFYEQLALVVPVPKVPEIEQIVIRITEAVEQAVREDATIDEALLSLERDVNGMLEKRRWMLARRARD
ncbi:MAG: sugar ABC transporter substrate-binding protein [Gemmatimonadota bacterium]|nr:sugar ABC transporter substrate-binding protein [Gemmatimonadota bacterium]